MRQVPPRPRLINMKTKPPPASATRETTGRRREPLPYSPIAAALTSRENADLLLGAMGPAHNAHDQEYEYKHLYTSDH